MGRKWLVASALSAFCCNNEASAFTLTSRMESLMSMGLRTKEDIMANMTREKALDMVLNKLKHSPDDAHVLLAKLQSQKAALRGMTQNRKSNTSQPSDYSGLKPATDMLNSMMNEARMKLDLSEIKCTSFERNQVLMLQQAQRDVATFNGQAAEARGQVLSAQGRISLYQEKIPQIQQELDTHRRTCNREIGVLKYELNVIGSDLKVVQKILNMTKCDSPTASAFLDMTSLVECAHCKTGAIMLQNSGLQPLMRQLKSDMVRGYMQQNLRSSFHAEALPAVALTQEQVRHQLRVLQHRQDPHHPYSADAMPVEISEMFPAQLPREAITVDLNISAEPVPPAPVDCMPTTRCVLKPTSCATLRDKFELVEGSILDKQTEYSEELVRLERFCEETDMSLSAQLVSLGNQLAEAQTDLALSTKSQVDAESGSHTKGAQHAELKAEYTDTLTKCCADQNDERSELCALETIRGELYNLDGHSVFIADCEVSPWTEQECSASCAGGTRIKVRSVVVHPSTLGTECPPLAMQESCNEQACPIDCVLEDWSGWSSCSAECGGGVIERTRTVRTAMRNDGEPCGETEESETCNIQACDGACTLADWSDWTTCNKGCGGGHRGRLRAVEHPALGSGSCPAEIAPERMEFGQCNEQTCTSLLPPDRWALVCDSKSDIIILLDGSGSLQSSGWTASKKMAAALAYFLQLNPDAGVKVALYLFSSASASRWITHLTTGTTKADVDAMTWPMGGTYTHTALAAAGEELLYGRDDANSVVVVITDGHPFSERMTLEAATELQKKARVIWVPVGPSAPLDMVRKLASEPVDDHVIPVPIWDDFMTEATVNKIISSSCPQVS